MSVVPGSVICGALTDPCWHLKGKGAGIGFVLGWFVLAGLNLKKEISGSLRFQSLPRHSPSPLFPHQVMSLSHEEMLGPFVLQPLHGFAQKGWMSFLPAPPRLWRWLWCHLLPDPRGACR